MKKLAKNRRAATDDAYYVSAADVADKLIDRMRRGLDPLLFASFSSALLSAGPSSRTHSIKEFD
jgi:hypothetical protein